MTEESARYIKKCLYTIALFCSLTLVLALVHYFTASLAEDEVRAAVTVVSARQKDKLPKPGDRVSVRNAGWTYDYAFRAKGSGDAGIFYAVRLTGNAGPYTGVFYSSPKKGTRFCGLAGVSDVNHSAAYYGITERIIDMWEHKLENLTKDSEAKK
jgi:hypothetical protein